MGLDGWAEIPGPYRVSAPRTVGADRPACWRRLAMALALLLALAAPAAAQQVQAIAAIVNDQVISAFDVEQRTRLVIASTRLRDTPENRRRIRGQVLRNLIDETLQLQEAQRAGISVQGADVKRAFATLEQQNNMPPGGLVRFLEQAGIAQETLERQITSEIAWGRLIGRRISPTITIGDEEIDETLARLQSSRGTALSTKRWQKWSPAASAIRSVPPAASTSCG
jgi:peptidyl-prolyl cis-trans isomerase SurA